MLLPQSQSIQELPFSTRGEVAVHGSAAIASGSVLQANAGARLIIEAGVSIGMGGIVHVYEGTLTIAAGACLGSGVLVVGSGKIGANACIGSMTTIINGCVEAGQVIPPGSLIGDESRAVWLGDVNASSPLTSNGATVSQAAIPEATVSEATIPEATVPETAIPEATVPEAEAVAAAIIKESGSLQPDLLQSEPSDTQMTKVYGLNAFNGLMTSLFPHRQLFNQPLNHPTSELDQAPHAPEG